jgi:hypothetical protein
MNADSRAEFVKWPSWVFRFIGLANLLFVSLGLFLMGGSALGVKAGRVGNDPTQPYFLQVFWTMTTINFVLLLWLALGSIRLLQLRVQGATICISVFVTEILYFLIVAFLWFPFSRPLSMSIAGASGVGDMGIGPQVITGYPLIALGGLILAARRRLRSAALSKVVPVPV